ncbi:hypothetical protein CWI37_1325p0010 [Hamiltosporidium tvaerminnensis]|uniref:Uncharacterized protein n=1 Tax=Hamiltosporidium tvaerminnensis TaxID=1176355 RepID=A0A4Q9KX54_9MICR|nr:hypothetical protein CWI37_1325p0010 [Hamiltosporidium tvaerminnensis]
MNISKVEYHKYISAVICLKVLCFKEELTDSEIVLRIIVEFLFLTDILYIEFNKCKNTERVKSIENNFQTFLDSHTPDVVIANLSLQHISLKTSNLIEILVIVETFFDQLFLDKLNTAIITKLKKTVNSTSKEGNMREFILYIVKTEKINNVPSTEKLQKEVHGEPSNILHNEIQEDELPSITPNDNRDVMNDFIENELANILREEVRNYLRNICQYDDLQDQVVDVLKNMMEIFQRHLDGLNQNESQGE